MTTTRESMRGTAVIANTSSSCFDSFSEIIPIFFNRLKRFQHLNFHHELIWIEVCQNVVFSKIDITMAVINKKMKSIKAEFCAIETCY